MRVNIAGVGVDAHSFAHVLQMSLEHAQGRSAPAYIVTPNAQHVMLLQSSGPFREAYRAAWLSVPDGVPLLWAARLLGTPLSGRVNGTDLFKALCGAAAERGLGVFLLGGLPGAAERAAIALQAEFPGLIIAGTHCPPYGFELDPTELQRVNGIIRAAAPHLLFVGLGAPKQECWMHENLHQVGVPVAVGIGGSFEMVAGLVKRAPRWMQRSGLEWVFRLCLEPRRLWKRYAVANSYFLWLIGKQLLLRRRGGIANG